MSPFQKYKGQNSQPTYAELETELEYLKGVQREQQSTTDRFEANGDINERLEAEV